MNSHQGRRAWVVVVDFGSTLRPAVAGEKGKPFLRLKVIISQCYRTIRNSYWTMKIAEHRLGPENPEVLPIIRQEKPR
jgi:hypothetical protein